MQVKSSRTGSRDTTGSASTGQQTLDDVLWSPETRDARRFPRLVVQAFRLVWTAAPGPLVVTGVLQVLAGLSLAGQLLVVRHVIARLQDSRVVDVAHLVLPLALFGGMLLIVAVTMLAQRELQRLLGDLVERHTSQDVMDVSTRVDLIDYDRPAFHDRLQRARVNASARPVQIANGVVSLLGGLVTVLAVGATLLWLEPLVVIVLVVGGVPTLVANRLSARVLHQHKVRVTPGDRRRAYLYQVLTRKEEAQEVRAFDSAPHLRREHDALFDERIHDLRRTVGRRMVYGTASAAATALVTVAAILMLLWFVRLERLELSDAAVAVGAVVVLGGRLRMLMNGSGSLYEGALFLQDFLDFVESGARVHDTGRARMAPPSDGFRQLDLVDVSFTYPSRSEPSLAHVSVVIRRGEVIALVGENGSGKTTLTKILAGLYRPTSGTMLWDGADTANMALTDLRLHVAVIFQDFARYFLTAHENVAIGRIQDVDDRDRVRRACADAGADSFLEDLPASYDTLLGPTFLGGSDLSGGQWQRIALARAYFRDAPLLVLDEPTASLDPRGEYEIFQQVRRIAAGRTVVLVSHRFSTARAADRILVLDAGRIVEEGAHEQLMAADGRYAELFRLQARGYQDPGTRDPAGHRHTSSYEG